MHPLIGLVIGLSEARSFLSRTAARGALGDDREREFTQTAWGADVEYSRAYYVVRAETLVYNIRDAGTVRRLGLFAAQLHFWF